MTQLTDAKLAEGRERAARMRRRIGRGHDDRVSALLAGGHPIDAKAIGAALGLTYKQVRGSLIRLGLWEQRARG